MDEYVKKENHTLRSVTAIMLFLIAYFHFFITYGNYGYDYSQELGDFVEELVGFGRFTIPIFFMISGYFLYSEDGHSEARLGKKALHILYLIILLKVSYLILVGVACMQGEVTTEYLINSFLICEMNSTVHVWFLYALFLMYAFFWLLYRYHIDFRKVYWIGWIPLVVTLFFGNIVPLFTSIEDATHIRETVSDNMYPFLGYTFFVFGYYLHQNKEKIDAQFSTLVLVIFMVVGTFMALTEAHYIPQRTLYFGTLLQIIGLFLITFRFGEDELRCRPLEYIGKNLMPFFYVYMMAPIFIAGTYFYGNISDFDFYIIAPIVCVFATLVISFIAYKVLEFALKSRAKKKAAPA